MHSYELTPLSPAAASIEAGETAFGRGDLAEAQHCFAEAASLDPQSSRARNNLGVVCNQSGDIPAAMAHFIAALTIDPTDSDAVLNLGSILIDTDRGCDAVQLYASFLSCTEETEVREALSSLRRASPHLFTDPLFEPRTVVFVANAPGAREAKIAWGLKNAGWSVVLLHPADRTPSFDTKALCRESYTYTDVPGLLGLARSFAPRVFHVFCNWNFNHAALLLQAKIGPVVIDDYDVFAGMMKADMTETNYPQQIARERFCLENAAGICCRSIETNWSKRHMGYRFRGKRIFFMDYCWDDPAYQTEKKINGTFRVANAGNLYINPSADINSPLNFNLKLARDLGRQGVSSNLYMSASRMQGPLKAFLLQEAATNPLIKATTLPYEELMRELAAECHAGLVCVPQGITSDNQHAYLQVKRAYGASNKVFDYFDAGLPIIIDRENKFLYKLIKRYHIGLDTQEFLGDVPAKVAELKKTLRCAPQQLAHARRTLSINANIPRLVKFYETVGRQ